MIRSRFHAAMCALVLLAMFDTVAAGDLILRKNDGSVHRIPLDASVRLSMEPGERSMVVRPAAGAGVAGDGWCPSVAPTFTVAFAVVPSFASAYQAVTANWTVSNATSCANTGSSYPAGVTSLAGWTSTLPTAGANRQVTLNKAGTYVLKITCSGPGGTVTAQKTVVAS